MHRNSAQKETFGWSLCHQTGVGQCKSVTFMGRSLYLRTVLVCLHTMHGTFHETHFQSHDWSPPSRFPGLCWSSDNGVEPTTRSAWAAHALLATNYTTWSQPCRNPRAEFILCMYSMSLRNLAEVTTNWNFTTQNSIGGLGSPCHTVLQRNSPAWCAK